MTSFSSRFHRLPEMLGTVVLCLLVPCCNPSKEVAITRKRVLPEGEQHPKTRASSEERFRTALRLAGFGTAMASQEPAPGTPRLTWDPPPDWKPVSGSAMRQADFRFGKDSEGECYLMRAGGSLPDNVNRWRQQMGLAPIAKEEVNRLPRRPLFGMDAYLISLDGDYTAMGSPEPKKGYRMLGVILPAADVSVFVKMVGPRDVVVENEAKFQAFCDSLRIEDS